MSEMQVAIGDSKIRNQTQVIDGAVFAPQASPPKDSAVVDLTRKQVNARIEKIGVVPALRLGSAEDAFFVADALAEAGVPIIEISAAEPSALDVMSRLVRRAAGIIVGAGSIFDTDTARRCLEAGVKFLSSDIFVPQVVEVAAKENAAVITGALTPTEVMAAWTAGSDFVKVTPCDANGHAYIRSLKIMMPQVRLIAAGGINQLTALAFIKAGATAMAVGDELVAPDAVWLRQRGRIQEMARRFRDSVNAARS
jgi:2-dehydro-3-deoxyphosphogluconate aldolase/(4S)-4-hydroxy-2-oxoglutarate aldolase